MKETNEEYVNFDKESTIQETGPHDAFPSRTFKPTQRWINEVPIDACLAEYELIKNKTSHCSSAQRKYIQERVEKHLESQNWSIISKI